MSELETTDREVHFSVEGHLFSFNTEELCEASEYFRAMLSGNFRESQENTIVLEDIDVKTFSIFHKWMLAKDEEFSLSGLETDELLQLIHLLDRLFVQKLMQICNLGIVHRLQNNTKLSKSQAVHFYCQFIEVAVTLANVELKELCVKWLFSKCFKMSILATMGLLESTKKEIAKVMEVELIKDICDTLSATASAEVKKMLTKRADEVLEKIEQFLEQKIHELGTENGELWRSPFVHLLLAMNFET